MPSLRRLAWAASPLAYPSLQIARQTRCRVLAGPFAGMRYPLGFLPQGMFGPPLQSGTYETELHWVFEEIVTKAPDVVVNVGAAEGYYAVGLARRLPATKVIAFEADAARREAARRLAELNGVSERLELHGLCTPGELARLDSALGDASVCLLMDCEGCERELADPATVPWLARSLLLIELHVAVDGEIESRLERRIADSHATFVVRGRSPWAARWPEVARLRGLRSIDRELLVAEFRHGGQDWLWATPR